VRATHSRCKAELHVFHKLTSSRASKARWNDILYCVVFADKVWFCFSYMCKCLVQTNNVQMARCACRITLCAHYAARAWSRWRRFPPVRATMVQSTIARCSIVGSVTRVNRFARNHRLVATLNANQWTTNPQITMRVADRWYIVGWSTMARKEESRASRTKRVVA
jgi:hypothetical protein